MEFTSTLASRIVTVNDLRSEYATYNILGFRGTASGVAVTNIDYKLTQEMWISGAFFLAQGTHWGDNISVQLVDKDNVLGLGQDYVLHQVATNFYTVTDSVLQLKLEATYISLLPANIYFRVIYTNTSLLDAVEIAINLITHVPKY